MFISCSSKPIPEILDLMIFVFQQLNSSNVRAWNSAVEFLKCKGLVLQCTTNGGLKNQSSLHSQIHL